MGNYLFKKIMCRMEVRILMVGLDAAGKTTILYKLKLGEVVTTTPTFGVNVETIEHKNVDLTCWDVGIRDKQRAMIRFFLPGTHGIVFVIDSNDREMLEEAITDFFEPLLSDDEMAHRAPVLVLANKQDIANAMTPEEITEKIETVGLLKSHPWKVFGTCALQGDGLYEALDWLTDAITEKKKTKNLEIKAGEKDKPKYSHFIGMVEYFKSMMVGK